ncbi:MAG: right-handed parallel beta-helix repeat-containing protein [Phycisphaerales bacterium]|nr:MAG: right-handed parallel beta-helix repeat-containing protein [Phycisphaerales bacterium]
MTNRALRCPLFPTADGGNGKPWRLLSAVALFAVISAPPAGAGPLEIHVDPAGEAGAVRELRAAVDELRNLRREGSDESAAIVLHEGIHRIREPIRIGALLAGQGLEIRAAEGAEATISGGVEIAGFEVGQDGLWRTFLPEVAAGQWWFEELFVNGERRPLARHPNEGWLRVERAGPDKRTSFTCQPGALPPDLELPGLRVVFLHDWSSSVIDVAAVNQEKCELLMADPIGANAPHYRIDNFEPHPRFRLQGSRGLLDAEGEWHLDRRTGELRYHPRKGERPEAVMVEAPRASALIEVAGEADRPVCRVILRNLRLTCASWPIPERGYAEGQAAFHELRTEAGTNVLRRAVPAAVSFQWAEACRIEECRIQGLGTSGVWFGAGCRECELAGCAVRDIAANGLMIGEDRQRRVEAGPWWQAAPGQVAFGNVVRDCLIERCGRRFYGAVGVWVGLAERTSIIHNEIRELPYTGVSVGWMWNPTPTPCRENLVEYNNIHHVMQLLSDGGGIYTLGRQPGTVLRGNAIHDIVANVGRAPSNGVFMDEGTTEIVLEGNVIWNAARTPIRFHRTRENTVRSNIFVIAGDGAIAAYNAASPEHITYRRNLTPEAAGWAAEEAGDWIGHTGPRPPYRFHLGL